jgi:hypothetical protein
MRTMTVGVFLLAVAALGCGGGAPRSADAGEGGGDTAASFLIECQPGASGVLVPAAYANPTEFSVNAQTGMLDPHTLTVLRRDVFDHTTTYLTAGPADHQHQVVLTLQQIEGILQNTGTTVVTGPPTQNAAGHTHTVSIKPCGIPGN